MTIGSSRVTDRPRTPNVLDYQSLCASFSWEQARAALDGLPGGRGLNIAHEAIDRHANGPHGDHIALRWLGRTGEVEEYSYRDLKDATNRFANVLASLGVQSGDRVAALTGRIPELYITAFGTLKHRAVFCPLFSAFGPEPIHTRLTIGGIRVLVAEQKLYERKVRDIRDTLPALQYVLLIRRGEMKSADGEIDLRARMASVSPEYTISPTDPEDPALLHFTSGTTGTPKGALHVHDAVVVHHVTGRLALDFHDGDVFWCTADPGWVTGTSYGIIAPLTNGITNLVDEADFDLTRWYRILAEQRVNVWYTAPTAIRMLMKAGTEAVPASGFPDLRFMGSVGEPLPPDAVLWGETAFGQPFHDNWWQTETGGILIANFAGMEVKPGSMGRQFPGIEAAIVHRAVGGAHEPVDDPSVVGELAFRPGWPSMFRAYWNNPERYGRCFQDGYYLSGDLARRDEDGYYWFIGRSDDVIKTSGHLVGPFEVESILLEHPAVAEVGVIGKPDPVAGEIIKAFIALKPGYDATEATRRDVLGFGRKRLGAALAPKEIAIVPTVPKTRSGKIMRRLLKARELGLPEGDVSTLEESSP